jgi:two-component system nitrogen regulation sensor histidine kinase NtrY
MSLRVRVVLAVLCAALVPAAGVALWARSALVARAEAAHDEALSRAVTRARTALDAQLAADRRGVERLCDGDAAIDALVRAREAGAIETEARTQLAASGARLLASLDATDVTVLDADGAVLAHAPAASRDGLREEARVRDALAAGNRAFVQGAPLQMDAIPRDGDVHALFTACTAGTGASPLVVVAGRALDTRLLAGLGGESASVTLALRGATDPSGASETARDIATLTDAAGTPALRVVAVRDDAPYRAALAAIERTVGLALLATALFAVLMGVLLARATTRPLASLEAAAARVASGDLASTIGGSPRGEAGRATAAFDHMTRELAQAQRRLVRAERIAAWRDIAQRIAHEIKNPLLPIQVSIETMRKTYARNHPDFPEIFEESTQMVLEEVRRLEHIVTEFSRFARLPRPRPEPLDVRELVAHLEAMHVTGTVPLRVEVEGTLATVRADREQLTQVLVNLLQNAAEAARARHGDGEGSAARVTLCVAPDAGGGVSLRVRDNGPGFPPGEARQRVFEPYFTTRAGGTGLGLAIVHRILGEHGASIELGDALPLGRDDASASGADDPALRGGAEVHVVLTREGPPPDAEASRSGVATGSLGGDVRR